VLSFASEISELRSLGFAESLPIEEAIDHARGIVVRLESGRRGVAVELCTGEDAPCYVIKPLVHAGGGSSMATNLWSDVLRDIHRRPPAGDDE
jgi:hypothetical protein